MLNEKWQILSTSNAPIEFVSGVQKITGKDAKYCAQLLWQRGIKDLDKLPGFLDDTQYQPASPFVFGVEIEWAMARLQQARSRQEKVTIWGDFDADGITSTSVLWDGLGQFFTQYLQLDYYIPNRMTESHGLNCPGIARLAEAGTKLIVTCDTGSTNLEEIAYATDLGIDIIVTDHHTLPESRPEVTAIINPRYLAKDHPLYSLSGVAVAYKLVEALYQTLPDIPQQPLENLLDLVAIGLIADLVELKGDCRYLAQIGIKQLQKQVKPDTMTRPGVAKLLNYCKGNGDRPTDISFGLGPRINAVSRIHGDASFCVELLTSKDPQRCSQLAEEAELANTRRKSLQKDTINRVTKKLQQLDLSTTSVIVLEDPQWQGGVLGLAAGQIAQEYGRPTVLLSSGGANDDGEIYARGSARSVNGIDLYQLVKSQGDLLHRFGGHPFAAGLSLPMTNLNLFKQGINQQLRQQIDVTELIPQIDVDLVVTVGDLGRDLFDELRQLEPYGMGNPIPKLLIKNCWFKNAWNQNIQDNRGNKIQYIKTTFKIWDETTKQGFPGLWWGHYKDEIPVTGKCEAIAELDFNTFSKQYEIRLVAVRLTSENSWLNSAMDRSLSIIDRRLKPQELDDLEVSSTKTNIMQHCPDNWGNIRREYRDATQSGRALVLAYTPDAATDVAKTWQKLVGIAKYLVRTQKKVSKLQIQTQLNIGDRSFYLGLNTLNQAGFQHIFQDNLYQFSDNREKINLELPTYIDRFISAIEEEKFQQQYFYQVPLVTINQQLVR
ncbi:single-stranded-DNA-specific exonuclease RecJ [Waterburya agarophytonicola K14]|uniref:Single-stranded-DNA-specific exonuclease RecJ n=1 Tax=Waterburya agarophytonicola KI4 TaxID=2874699 RepID=A0A964BSA8_9CYAN|nr:single-stranded-DNA-specific exonuclease RecJ [Waterburya agarophytonicola]MCC0177302.1 single-stranded-DNA-specific exonuclease RecJ [Waterburya agarophytonicola KI4]